MRTTLTATALGVAYLAGHGFIGLLAILVYCWASSMITASNTAKTVANEQLIAQHATRINGVEAGALPNVPGGPVSVVQTTGSPVTLHAGALANFTGGGNTAFLASLAGPGPSQTLGLNSSGSPDGNSGTAWGTGERQYINGLWASVNGIINVLRNSGFIN